MAKTKQFTIAVQNRPGAVAEIARTLGDAKVNILALLGTAQGTGGAVQLVVEDLSQEGARRSQALVPGDCGRRLRAAQQAGCAGAIFREARNQRRQLKFDLRHGHQRRKKSCCRLRSRGCGKS